MQDNRYQILNAEQHGELRVKRGYAAELGDNVMSCMIFPSEFRNVQATYPILFQRNPEDGKFYCLALFGFEQGENLFLTEHGWDQAYVPLMMQRQPFLIAFQQRAGEAEKQAVISVDTESPRLNAEEGERLFEPHGGVSPYLSQMSDMLESIHRGHQQTEMLCELLLKHKLIESFTLDVTLDNGEQCQLHGFYAINEEQLQTLPGDALQELQDAGALAPVFMAVASQSQFRPLIARKNRQA